MLAGSRTTTMAPSSSSFGGAIKACDSRARRAISVEPPAPPSKAAECSSRNVRSSAVPGRATAVATIDDVRPRPRVSAMRATRSRLSQPKPSCPAKVGDSSEGTASAIRVGEGKGSVGAAAVNSAWVDASTRAQALGSVSGATADEEILGVRAGTLNSRSRLARSAKHGVKVTTRSSHGAGAGSAVRRRSATTVISTTPLLVRPVSGLHQKPPPKMSLNRMVSAAVFTVVRDAGNGARACPAASPPPPPPPAPICRTGCSTMTVMVAALGDTAMRT
mmetsp:Transcript_72678/g.142290  ORF Transcript_72678/g.142290 Transcript_72678/m.142290 type:complete len:276 (+) Transcript_72678:812-1639(+)